MAENEQVRIHAVVLFQIGSMPSSDGSIFRECRQSRRQTWTSRFNTCFEFVSIASSCLESKLPGLRLIDPTIAFFPSAITILP
jgi:hypothetical protein